MTTPSGQISLDDIWQEANPGWTGARSFGNIAYNSWAEGPLGTTSNSYNGWGGDGGNNGKDAIYNTGAPLIWNTDPINFQNYTSKTYYFDGTTYDIQYSWNNTLNNTPVPPPPILNDVSVDVNCYDYSGTYTVHPGFSIPATAATSQGATTIPGFSANTYPLVENVWWDINIITDPSNNINGIDFSINGTVVYTTGGGGGSFNWNSVGASQGYTNGSGIVYDIYVY